MAESAPHRFDVPGLLRSHVQAEVEIDYPLHVRTLEHGAPGPIDMDAHQGLEVNLVLEGRFARFFEDLSVTAGPGDVHLVGPWEPHAWRVVEPDTTAVVLIFLSEVVEQGLSDVPWLRMFTVPPGHRPRVATPELRQEVLAIGWEMLAEGRERRPGWLVAERLCLLRMLLALHRSWSPPRESAEQPPVQPALFDRLRPAVELVHADPRRRVTQAEAAAACGLRPSRFGRLFRETVGIAFGDFRLRLRIAVVAHRLLSTSSSIESIAEETGFVDGSHLHHAFLKYYGYTPGQFREMRR